MNQLLLTYAPEPEWKSQRLVEKFLKTVSQSAGAKPRIRIASVLPASQVSREFKLDLSYPSKGE